MQDNNKLHKQTNKKTNRCHGGAWNSDSKYVYVKLLLK